MRAPRAQAGCQGNPVHRALNSSCLAVKGFPCKYFPISHILSLKLALMEKYRQEEPGWPAAPAQPQHPGTSPSRWFLRFCPSPSAGARPRLRGPSSTGHWAHTNKPRTGAKALLPAREDLLEPEEDSARDLDQQQAACSGMVPTYAAYLRLIPDKTPNISKHCFQTNSSRKAKPLRLPAVPLEAGASQRFPFNACSAAVCLRVIDLRRPSPRGFLPSPEPAQGNRQVTGTHASGSTGGRLECPSGARAPA